MDSPFYVALCCNGSLLPGFARDAGLTGPEFKPARESLPPPFSHRRRSGQPGRTQGTVLDAGGVGHLELRDVTITDFEDFNTLHGDTTIYLRLLLPNLLPEASTIVYLDSDLVVLADVCEMFAFPLNETALGAIPGEMIRYSLDRDVFMKLGLGDEGTYFNSGVLLINAAQWRKTGVIQQALEFARANPSLLRSHDQTILNVLFSLTYYRIPHRFNTPLARSKRKSRRRPTPSITTLVPRNHGTRLAASSITTRGSGTTRSRPPASAGPPSSRATATFTLPVPGLSVTPTSAKSNSRSPASSAALSAVETDEAIKLHQKIPLIWKILVIRYCLPIYGLSSVSKNRSASIAAAQPVPAAVIACR